MLHQGMGNASGRRVALVIGNAAYDTESFNPLRNPVNDARGMSQVLEEIGFEVLPLYDANRVEIGDAVHEFSQRIGSEGVALFYFSGHGLQVEGQKLSGSDRCKNRRRVSGEVSVQIGE